jgi:hypothetical protein
VLLDDCTGSCRVGVSPSVSSCSVLFGERSMIVEAFARDT